MLAEILFVGLKTVEVVAGAFVAGIAAGGLLVYKYGAKAEAAAKADLSKAVSAVDSASQSVAKKL